MKQTFTLCCLFLSVLSRSQTICGTSPEGGTVTITAPPGSVIVSIDFASYGTPNGSCGSFTIGGCHSSNSVAIVSTALLGLNSGSVDANNAIFGDPCGGTFKRLYVQATYSALLPVSLLSFTARKLNGNTIELRWSTDHEMNIGRFIPEISTDGIHFSPAGLVNPSGNTSNQYQFLVTPADAAPVYYFRLKWLEADGSFRYSSIVRVNSLDSQPALAVFPNPATDRLTISSPTPQQVWITDLTGRMLRRIGLSGGDQSVDISSLAAGTYILKGEKGVTKFVKE